MTLQMQQAVPSTLDLSLSMKETSIYEKWPVKGTCILYMCQTISLQCYRGEGGTWSIVTKGILVIIKRRLQKFSEKLAFFSMYYDDCRSKWLEKLFFENLFHLAGPPANGKYTHAHAHTRTHTHTHAHTYSRSHTHAHTHTHRIVELTCEKKNQLAGLRVNKTHTHIHTRTRTHPSFFLSLCLSLSHTHTHVEIQFTFENVFCEWNKHTHTLSLSLSLSLAHTRRHTHSHTDTWL